MKKQNLFYIHFFLVISFIIAITLGCKKDDIEKGKVDPVELASINILPVNEITAYSAKSGGNITNDGGAGITARGVIWSTSENPTVENYDGKTTDGEGNGEFTSKMENLLPGTIYFVKAYAINIEGTAYSDSKEFITKEKKFAGGSGTENDPYLIETPAQLDSIRYDINQHYKQIADIDLSNFSSEDWIPEGYWIPIGDNNNPFTGSYDGNNNTILNLTINLPDVSGIGLFGYAFSAEIKNIAIENIDISGGASKGGLVGNISEGNIFNCFTTGKIDGGGGGLVGINDKGNIKECYSIIEIIDGGGGGLVGHNSGNILDSHAIGVISGSSNSPNVGGLVGLNGGEINNCYADVDVEGGWYVGGLVGSNIKSIINCMAMGNVLGKVNELTFVGGLVGYSRDGIITNCIAKGNVSGSQYIGGLIGKNERLSSSTELGKIINSYSIGNVTGNNSVGGLIGFNELGNIIECYALGDVSSEEGYTGGHVDCTGGLIGKHQGDEIQSFGHGDVNRCYALGAVSGNKNVGGLVGYNDAGKILNSYAKGAVTGIENIGGIVGYYTGEYCEKIANCFSIGSISGDGNLGGLIGKATDKALNGGYIKIDNCYYDKDTSGQNDTGKGTPKTTTEMMQQYTFYPHWDFETIWDINEGESYPYLRWQE
jgi:hypothetical protein